MSNPVFIPLVDPKASKPTYPAVLALGFRPFYLLGALWLVLAVPIWMVMYGHGLITGSHLQAMDWHGHEMLFGFAGAIIVGFLFTAVKNWTNQDTPIGWPLAALAAVWIAARVLLMTGWSEIGAVLDVAFYLLAAAGIARPMLRSGNKRNLFFIALLTVFAAVSGWQHLAAMGLVGGLDSRELMQLALSVVTIIVTVITGRVIPMFTSNAVPGAPVRKLVWLERASVISVIALALLAVTPVPAALFHVAALLAALIHGWRWWNWAPHWTLKKPILWILHASYLWLPIGFLLKAIPTAWAPMAGLLSTHALTVGVIGGLCIGMMTRTARGHTGRPLQASSAEVWAYALVLAATVFRVLLPLIVPDFYRLWTGISSLLFISGFAIYVAVFGPWLMQPRVDGRPG